MQHLLRAMVAAFAAVILFNFSITASAQPSVQPVMKQIKLTEKQILSFIAAQKDMATVLEKIQGETTDPLPPKLQAELETVAKKHGFKDFNEYDEVVANITMVMSGIDPKTKAFTEPSVAIKKEIDEVTNDKKMSAQDKKQALEELNEALKSVQPIEFPSNIELIKKYYDKIDAALT
jgi:hypothetical protein